MTEVKPTCGRCQATLEWLGSHMQRAGGGPEVKVVHWSCPACKTRWVHHSERGWRETKVDLTAD
jgi:hypothetical protein